MTAAPISHIFADGHIAASDARPFLQTVLPQEILGKKAIHAELGAGSLEDLRKARSAK